MEQTLRVDDPSSLFYTDIEFYPNSIKDKTMKVYHTLVSYFSHIIEQIFINNLVPTFGLREWLFEFFMIGKSEWIFTAEIGVEIFWQRACSKT